MSYKGSLLISVIVPIYNTYEFLPRCLDSIVSQTYTNMEIILVNDGSTDGSLCVCEKYAADDNRIRIISQPNQGALAAKREGVRVCRGEYVMFVDSDDWIEPELLAAMTRTMRECDCSLVCTNVYIDTEGSTTEKRNGIPSGIYETQEVVKDLFYYKDTDEYGILPYNVAKLYPRDILKEAIDDVSYDIRNAEDKAIVFCLVLKNINICFTDDIYYHYCTRRGSATQSENPDYLVELTAVYKYIKKLFDEQKEREHLLRQLGKWLWIEAGYAINGKLGLATFANPIYREPYRLDPSAFFSQKKRLILYGAGNVGADYRRQIPGWADIELRGWVDRNYEKCREKGLDVQPVEYIWETEYDYILVAVNRQAVFRQIKDELISKGIAEEAVIWGRPCGASCESL